MRASLAVVLTGLVFACAPASAQQSPAQAREAATAQAFERAKVSPPDLRAFLQRMPKGGDLHNHTSGAVYAERYLTWAIDDGFCVTIQTFVISAPPCDASAGRPSVSDATGPLGLRERMIDALSMRAFVPGVESGHDHFFDTFAKFGAIEHGHRAEAVAQAVRQASQDHAGYLELMYTFDSGDLGEVVKRVPFDPDLGRLRAALFAAGMDRVIDGALNELRALETGRRKALGCDASAAAPGCEVTLRYIMQAIRVLSPVTVYAQMILGQELAARDPRVVAVNLVAPEDAPVAVRDYDLHMRMLDALYTRKPFNITLHAGELTLGLVPRDVLYDHITKAVAVGHARRIGHGVDLRYELDSNALLERMRRERVLVEIALSSNDLILGVRGLDHPLPVYLRAGVPVALVTDDEGVSRIDLTHEYERAVRSYGFDYRALKRFARNALEYAFLPPPEKAREQARLERDFAAFEQTFVSGR